MLHCSSGIDILSRAPMAQLVELRTTIQEVEGSNPGRTTTQSLIIIIEQKVLPS